MVGITFSWSMHFGSHLAEKFETLKVSLAWDVHGMYHNVHGMHPGLCGNIGPFYQS